MNSLSKLEVLFDGRRVGTLARTADGRAAFSYSDEWIEHGFLISPFKLPLRKEVFLPRNRCFEGLHGVFADSLPDAWGRLLLTRILRERGIDEGKIGALDRLAFVGDEGAGALCYHPQEVLSAAETAYDLDDIAEKCHRILMAESSGYDLDLLYQLGGTSGGARPKIFARIDGEDWIVKFPSRHDFDEMGKMEYDYTVCAASCGIRTPRIRLFHSERCGGYFGAKRFDRTSDGRRLHMLTAAALLEIDYRTPCLDYRELLKMASILSDGSRAELQEMYRRMCFNVFAHNRDDHAKNFSWLYDESTDSWRMTPAYDLTYSNTSFGEHTTSVNGNGFNPDTEDLVAVGVQAGLSGRWCKSEAGEIRAIIAEQLSDYLH